MSYVKDWEKAKKDFAAKVVGHLQAGGAGVPADLKQAVVTLLKTETGMTPALKEVDAAFDKKERKPAMSGLTKVHGAIEKAAMHVQKVALSAGSAAADAADQAAQNALNEIQMAGLEFKRTLTGFETRIAKQLEQLQEEKSPGGVKIDIISLEGDMNGAIEKFKKDAKPHAALEKEHKVLDATAGAAKAMQAYSKAAARTEVKNALDALQDYFAAVDKLDTHRKKVVADCKKTAAALPTAAGKAVEAYVKAVDTLCDALKTIKAQRGTVSLKNLQALAAAGH